MGYPMTMASDTEIRSKAYKRACDTLDVQARSDADDDEQLVIIRIYQRLYALIGGNPDAIRHWMHTSNRGTGGVPAEQLLTSGGTDAVRDYLESLRT